MFIIHKKGIINFNNVFKVTYFDNKELLWISFSLSGDAFVNLQFGDKSDLQMAKGLIIDGINTSKKFVDLTELEG